MENAFGILASRFRVFFVTPMLLSLENTQKVVLASCVLHNFLRNKSPSPYTPPRSLDRENANGNLIEGDWRTEINDCQCGNNFSRNAKLVPDFACILIRLVKFLGLKNSFDYIKGKSFFFECILLIIYRFYAPLDNCRRRVYSYFYVEKHSFPVIILRE